MIKGRKDEQRMEYLSVCKGFRGLFGDPGRDFLSSCVVSSECGADGADICDIACHSDHSICSGV